MDAMNDEAPTQGYCRLHGVHRSVCGCRVASVDPDALGGRENGSCDFISYVITADPDSLAKVDNAPEKPSEALQRLFDTTRSTT